MFYQASNVPTAMTGRDSVAFRRMQLYVAQTSRYADLCSSAFTHRAPVDK
jgi:hypothetical protein